MRDALWFLCSACIPKFSENSSGCLKKSLGYQQMDQLFCLAMLHSWSMLSTSSKGLFLKIFRRHCYCLWSPPINAHGTLAASYQEPRTIIIHTY
ncbi:hypothetical protein Patl1_09434 [Pistacia atlantica]|uniref:Uncharacterized protein n=1 Tax=Pistacia atlantica TaxID=434234 RepID=A0ACC1AJ30_9ROSI|nr:hypothetical protein Patl1_09434 [Pistacia atlantica]